MNNIFSIGNIKNTLAGARDKAHAAIAGHYDFNTQINGRVLPPIPPYPKGTTQELKKIDSGYTVQTTAVESQDTIQFSVFGTPMCFPLEIKLKSESDWWLLPVEPVITLGGSNDLIRRKVAKTSSGLNARRGTIKERWAQDDYSISIDGILTRFDQWSYPTEDVQRLRAIVEARQPIDVKCQLLEIFGIGRIVVDKYDFPFTKGEENQAYRLSAFSDDDWDLLIKLTAQ